MLHPGILALRTVTEWRTGLGSEVGLRAAVKRWDAPPNRERIARDWGIDQILSAKSREFDR
jgi:hypothetical protein